MKKKIIVAICLIIFFGMLIFLNIKEKNNKEQKDKVVYLRDYKKYFYEEVKTNFLEGLKVNLIKKKGYSTVIAP